MKRTGLQRRSVLKRTAALKRQIRLPRRRDLPRRGARVRDPAYLAQVRTLPCWFGVTHDGHRCDGRMEADHAGYRGLGAKSNDDEAIPLCLLHHRQRTDFSGPFKGWDQGRMRGWLNDGITWTRGSLEMDRARADIWSGASQKGALARYQIMVSAVRHVDDVVVRAIARSR